MFGQIKMKIPWHSNRHTYTNGLLKNYKWWQAPSPNGQGLLTGIKKNIALITQAEMLGSAEKNSRVITIKIHTSNILVLLIASYWPPGSETQHL
jgi:hypothetical protein